MSDKRMTVGQLMDALAKFNPDLPLWEHNTYGTGVRPAAFHPKLATVAVDPSGQGNPRTEKDLEYMKRPERYTERVEVVYL